jgi:hypothetical protein
MHATWTFEHGDFEETADMAAIRQLKIDSSKSYARLTDEKRRGKKAKKSNVGVGSMSVERTEEASETTPLV